MRELRSWGAAHPWAVDIGLALVVQAAMTMPFVVPRGPELEPATWPAYGLTTLTVVPLVWRRRAPMAVLLAILATSALYKLAVEGPGQPLPYTGLVSVYTIAVLAPSWQRIVTAGLMVVAVPASVWLNTQSVRELTFSLFVFGAAYAFGRLTEARQRAQTVEAERAAARERARIAREMHDVLSHAVSLMIVQAEAGPLAVRAAPERAEAAFEAISAAGRDAMTQLRGMLGVLREGEEAPRAPQPGIGDLPALLEGVRAGGLTVGYATEGGVRALPAAAGASVYRIVQEALTNVVKHARARAVDVRLVHADGVLRVTVTDDGRGPQGGPGGHGLVGIRERAGAHGGTAETGPGPDGRGFEVRVLLPVAETAGTRKVGA
ncbi:two-component sensor histidine kinase [Streptomyces tanashiensis]|uniref:sensor histidine kinase n=1 Tax=Streptomyces tanashiensis TaxID=67367 RepID=UPI0019A9E2B6|nr:histidine kinase [Streptomyces tanashiensis]GGT18711.1 two-component sensor histidine kinase [Streptomyces tanashiensis]